MGATLALAACALLSGAALGGGAAGAPARARAPRPPAILAACRPSAPRARVRAAAAGGARGRDAGGADDLYSEWQACLDELGVEELSRWEREERKLSLWKRIVAREERRAWRRRSSEVERAARAELAASQRRALDATAAENEASAAEVEERDGALASELEADDADFAAAWAAGLTEPEARAPRAGRAPARERACSTVGIDLGTTNSLVAVFRDGAPRVLEVNGSPIVPSAVAYVHEDAVAEGAREAICAPLNSGGDSGRNEATGVLVGTAARAHAASADASATVRSVKRILGRRDLGAEDVSRMRWLSALRVRGAGGTGELLLSCPALEVAVSPAEVSAEVVRTLLDGACAELGAPVRRAVVTVPAHFSDAQRAATETACQLAGLEQTYLLREPEAAALAYGHGRAQDERCLIFDLGGGTFDVSVVDVGGNTIEIISTGGDVSLGGDDFDEAIAAYATTQLLAQTGVQPDARSHYLIVCAAQEARHALSTQTSAAVRLRGLSGTRAPAARRGAADASSDGALGGSGAGVAVTGVELDVPLSRRKMEALARPLLERMVPPLVKAAQDAGIRLNVAEQRPESGSPEEAALGDGAAAARLGKQTKAARARANVAWRWQRMARRWAEGNHKLQRFAPGVPISRVVLVGGATRMPCIGRLIKRVTGVTARPTIDPETAVAEGAAIQAAILDGQPSAGNLAVFNPHHGGRLHRRRDAAAELSGFDALTAAEVS